MFSVYLFSPVLWGSSTQYWKLLSVCCCSADTGAVSWRWHRRIYQQTHNIISCRLAVFRSALESYKTNTTFAFDSACLLIDTARVNETVECPSVRLCPTDRPQQRRAAGLLLSARQAGDRPIARLLHVAASLSSIALSRGQCHVDSWRRKQNTDLSFLSFQAAYL